MSRPLETTSDAILQAVDYAIISCDIDGVIVTWNRGAEALYGYTALEAIGSPIDIIMPPEIAPTLKAGIEDANSVLSSETIETERLTKSKQTVEVAISESPIYDGEGNLVGLAAIHREISKQKLAEKSRRDLAVVGERNRLAREFHDTLVQTLTVMILRLGFLGESIIGDPVAAQQELGSIELLVTKCVEDVRRSVWDLQPQALDSSGLEAAVRNEVERLRETEIYVALTVSGAEAVPMGGANKAAVLRIVQGSLNNIVKHSKAKTASVYLGFEPEEVCITVADNGIGFERSTRQANQLAYRGFGIGSMHDRARLTGGSVKVHSTLGQGTTVEARIPYFSP
jgi:PAS domain S-box-containing protein